MHFSYSFRHVCMYVCMGLIALFAHSCATDASADPADTLAPTSIEFRNLDPDPETDCKCYIRILRAENAPPPFDLWAFYDITYDAGILDASLEIEGNSNIEWRKLPEYNWTFFPSEEIELPAPSNGIHTLALAVPLAIPSANFTVKTEVKCYLQNNDNTETLLTTTYHDFIWSEGEPDQTDSQYVTFEREFSCYYLTEQTPVGRN